MDGLAVHGFAEPMTKLLIPLEGKERIKDTWKGRGLGSAWM